jgi:hypothetical protein
MQNASIIFRYCNIPGLNGPVHNRHARRLRRARGIAEHIGPFLAQRVQQGLRLRRDDDLDIGPTGLARDRRAHYLRDGCDAIGHQRGGIRLQAHHLGTHAAFPARDFTQIGTWGGKALDVGAYDVAQIELRGGDRNCFQPGRRICRLRLRSWRGGDARHQDNTGKSGMSHAVLPFFLISNSDGTAARIAPYDLDQRLSQIIRRAWAKFDTNKVTIPKINSFRYEGNSGVDRRNRPFRN